MVECSFHISTVFISGHLTDMLQPNLTNLRIFKIGKTLVLVLLAEAGVTFPRADISQLNVPRDKAWVHCKSLGEPSYFTCAAIS